MKYEEEEKKKEKKEPVLHLFIIEVTLVAVSHALSCYQKRVPRAKCCSRVAITFRLGGTFSLTWWPIEPYLAKVNNIHNIQTMTQYWLPCPDMKHYKAREIAAKRWGRAINRLNQWTAYSSTTAPKNSLWLSFAPRSTPPPIEVANKFN